MSWLFERRTVRSAINGDLVVQRVLGRWSVLRGSFDYTSPYLHDMWRQVIRRFIPAPDRPRIKTVLMLGLGGGGEVRTLNEYFPGSDITVVEYDPDMVRIAAELRLYEPYPAPRILTEDAKAAVRSLAGPYDLIIIDIFLGEVPSPLVAERGFLEAIDALLAPGGYVLANIFKEPQTFLRAADAIFGEPRYWIYKFNRLGIFRKKEPHA